MFPLGEQSLQANHRRQNDVRQIVIRRTDIFPNKKLEMLILEDLEQFRMRKFKPR